MKPVKTSIWDASSYLESEEEITAYLNDIFETGDAELILAAIGDVSRARGMSKIAADTNLARESLYKSFSESGNPSFSTVVKVMATLGFGIQPRPIRTS